MDFYKSLITVIKIKIKMLTFNLNFIDEKDEN